MTLPHTSEALIAEIYEAALEPEGWGAVLTKISDRLDGAAIIADVRAHAAAPPLALFPVRFDIERLLVSVEEYGDPGENPTLDHARDGSPVGTFFDRREIMDDRSFERSAVSRAVLFPQGLYEASACALDRRPDRLSVMALARGREKGAFSPDELGYLHGLAGHLKRALELTARMQESRIANDYLDRIVEALPHGTIAVDEHWRVLGTNAAARALLSEGAVFDYQTNRISLPDPNQQQKLLAAMAGTTAFAGQPARDTGHCIIFGRNPPEACYQISVLRCDRPTTAHSAGKTIFLLTIRPMTMLSPRIEPMIRDCFALTRSEARLAASLARAGTLEEALGDLSITRNTAKTHLRRIFHKTATRNQVELVRLLTSLQAG